MRPVFSFDCIENLIGLLDGVRPDAFKGLLAIPGASAGCAQLCHDAHCFDECSLRCSVRRLVLRSHADHSIANRILAPLPMMPAVYMFLAFLFGAVFGSFLNVCITRLPLGESIVRPRSHCRDCDHTLAWWENLPVISWIMLRGHCSGCQAPIAWRYPLV